MAKRKNIKERRKAQEQAKQQKRMVQIGAVVVFLVILGAIGFFALRSAMPSVTQERLELDPYFGNPDAPITIVEYSTFGCEACRYWHNSGLIEDVLETYPDQVKLIFRDMPIIDPLWSQEMGEIAQCALDQSNDAFQVAYNVLFEDTIQGVTTQSASMDLIEARNEGINMDDLRSCVDANTHYQTVRYDMQRPEARALRGIPVWFVNGQQVAGAQAILPAIESALNS